MTTPASGGTRRIPGPGAALLLLLTVALLFVFGGVPLQLLLGEVGLLVAQIAFLILPVVVFLRRWGFDPQGTLPLRIPSGREVAGGVLFLAGGLQLALFLAHLQSLVLPVPVEYLEALSGALEADSLGRYLWLLILAALLPAVAEETLFRGVVLSAFRTKLPTVWAVIAVGAVFGVFHLTPQTAFRFVPTAWLGIVLAWVVVVSGSLPLAMLLHFLNNAAVLTVTAISTMNEQSVDLGVDGPPLQLFVVGSVLFAIGLWTMRGARRREGEP